MARQRSSHAFDVGEDASDAKPAQMEFAEVDIPRIERAVREILLAVGEDPDREGLLKDAEPRRPRLRGTAGRPPR